MKYLAFDLGASSGRAILGTLTDEGLELTEVHRFSNDPVSVSGTLHWDVLRLWHEIKEGIRAAVHQADAPLRSLGVDTWGCDFALLDDRDRMIANPVHYRDARTNGILDALFDVMEPKTIFAHSGVQFLPLNTLPQLVALRGAHHGDLERAATFLTMPDLFHFWLTGRKVNEFTNATTTQCLNPQTMAWSGTLLRAFELPERIFQDIEHPGTVLGELTPELAGELDVSPIPVTLPACHDTGSAVAAIPSSDRDSIWISSGTWSIMGVTTPTAILGAEALAHNFTNEGGVGQTYRFCKNIMGLWLLQECQRTWARQGQSFTFAELSRLGGRMERSVAIIDPDHADFLAPGDMPTRIQAYCHRTGQTPPTTVPEILRCIFDSLALKYRWVLERMEWTLSKRLSPIHVVGGGSQNDLLNQATADATDREVLAGPAEATATGNILVQAVASGEIGSFSEIGAVVRQSASLKSFAPVRDTAARTYWDESYARLESLMPAPPGT